MIIKQQVKVPFSIGTYKDEVNCDIVPMEARHILLRRSWQFDRKIIYNGLTNEITLTHLGTKFVLHPQTPSHVAKDLSYPNFVWGPSFGNVLILPSWIELLNTNCRVIHKVFWRFGRECGKYSKRRAKGSFWGLFKPLGPLESLGVKKPARLGEQGCFRLKQQLAWASYCSTSSLHFL